MNVILAIRILRRWPRHHPYHSNQTRLARESADRMGIFLSILYPYCLTRARASLRYASVAYMNSDQLNVRHFTLHPIL